MAFEKFNNKFKVGDMVKIITDNENFYDYMNENLIITSIINNISDHIILDECVMFQTKTFNGHYFPFLFFFHEIDFV